MLDPVQAAVLSAYLDIRRQTNGEVGVTPPAHLDYVLRSHIRAMDIVFMEESAQRRRNVRARQQAKADAEAQLRGSQREIERKSNG